jgi:hypothetical protein
MNDQKQQKKDIQLERRAIISPLFLAVLMGIAYDRMLEVAHKSLLSGLIVNDLLLIVTFLLVSMRFFIGNQLYLVSEDFKKLKELAWLYDYFVITGQTICIVFLGSFCSVQANGYSSIGFLQFLLILYVIDVVWIISLVILSNWTVRSSRKINEFTRVSAPNALQTSSRLIIAERLSKQGF